MKDHWSQITMANRKGSSLKYHRNYQKVAQRYGVNKYCWRNAWCRLPQIFNLWKTWYLWTAVKQYTLKVPVVVPQRLPPPNHQNLSMCQVTRQRRMEVAMALRLLISWPYSRGESTPSRQVQCNRRVLASGRGRQECSHQRDSIWGRLPQTLLGWSKEGSRGKKDRKRLAIDFLLETFPANDWFSSSETWVEILTNRTRTDLCSLKLLNLWWFVTATLEN